MSTHERSPGGSDILRHQATAGDGQVADADDARLVAHLARTIGAPVTVWHELVSDRVHVDVHVVPPSAERPWLTLVTSGMSARPMTLPADMPDADTWRHAELCLLLPPDWPLERPALDDERNYWPIRLLKTLARLPHEYRTWLGWGHSIPNGNPARTYAPDTQLSGALIIPPNGEREDFFVVDGAPVLHIFQVLPVTAAEMAYKLEHGLDPLLDKLEETLPDVYGPLDRGRASGV